MYNFALLFTFYYGLYYVQAIAVMQITLIVDRFITEKAMIIIVNLV